MTGETPKTHFRCGHEIIPENTFVNSWGPQKRECRTCRRMRDRRRYETLRRGGALPPPPPRLPPLQLRDGPAVATCPFCGAMFVPILSLPTVAWRDGEPVDVCGPCRERVVGR